VKGRVTVLKRVEIVMGEKIAAYLSAKEEMRKRTDFTQSSCSFRLPFVKGNTLVDYRSLTSVASDVYVYLICKGIFVILAIKRPPVLPC
jgi:hypothetical protein